MHIVLEILKSILFGVVEGITEWLPVSSTGHLILLNEWVKFDLGVDMDAFMELYDVVIQLGAILAVVILFWGEIWPFDLRSSKDPMLERRTRKRKSKQKKGDVWYLFGDVVVMQDIIRLWGKIIVACIPGVLYGFLLDDLVESLTAPYRKWIVAVMLILVGVLFIVIETLRKNKAATVTTLQDLQWQTALWIGLFQLIAAVLPGTSRSGATILGGLLLGLSRGVAAEFTFFLAIPTMAGASLLKTLKFISGGGSLNALSVAVLVISCATAFAVSMAGIRFLLGYIRKHDFRAFGWYRIVLGVAVLLYFILL